MTSTELTRAGNGAMPTGQEIDTAVRIAQNLAAGGMFKDARQAEQAFTKIMLGRDLGLSPTMAMTSIHVVEGKPELSANLQAQLVKSYLGPEGERYDYLVREHDTSVCEIEFRRREQGGEWETLGTERFTIDDAKAAGLVRANSPWTKYPRNMLWARAISNGVNFHCPEVARGLRVFHEGEISGEVSEAALPAPEAPQTTPQHVEDPDLVPEPGEAVELLGAGDRATELAKLADDARKIGGLQSVTILTNAGATDDSSMRALCASLPVTAAEEVEAQLRAAIPTDADVAEAEMDETGQVIA